MLGYLFQFLVLSVNLQQIINKNKMKKIVSFFAMAAFVVALSSCGNKATETTDTTATDSMSTMESASEVVTESAAVIDSASAVIDSAAATMAPAH